MAKPTARRVLKRVILDYCLETGRMSFTYNSLRRFYYKGVGEGRYPCCEWHTLERYLRKFAEEKLLKHNRRGKLVIFTVTEELFYPEYRVRKEELTDKRGLLRESLKREVSRKPI